MDDPPRPGGSSLDPRRASRLRVLIAMAEPFFPQQGGGSQTSALELARALREQGMEVALAAALDRRTAFGLRAIVRMFLRRRRFDLTLFQSHPVYRATPIADCAHPVVRHWRPDVALVQGMSAMRLAHALTGLRVPTVVYWRDVEVQKLFGTPEGLKARFIANSRFTASFYRSAFGLSSVVIPPLIQRERYVGLSQERDTVLFVGSAPEKGLEVAIEVAASCPEIPFVFVESWILKRSARARLRKRLARLPNVSFLPHRMDMRPIYGRARLLLVPSQWQEAWGRVASEAHINGIPVLATRIGGLAEAVGPGGVLLDPEASVSEWCNLVRELWKDKPLYGRLAAAAEAYSHRQELDPVWNIGRIADELRLAYHQHS